MRETRSRRGLAEPELHAHRLDQVVDAAGRHSLDVGLDHHRIQRLVDATAGLQDRREERPLAQLRDPQLDVTGLGCDQPRRAPLRSVVRDSVRSYRPAPIRSVASASINSCITIRTDSRIRSTPSPLRNASSSSDTADWDKAIGGDPFGECLAVHTEDPADGP